MDWLPSSKLNSFRMKTGQIGIGCSRTRKCSQRYEIDHFWPWFFASVQSLKFFLNPIREPAVSFNPTSQLLLKLRCGSTDVIWKYLSLLGFATGIILLFCDVSKLNLSYSKFCDLSSRQIFAPSISFPGFSSVREVVSRTRFASRIQTGPASESEVP